MRENETKNNSEVTLTFLLTFFHPFLISLVPTNCSGSPRMIEGNMYGKKKKKTCRMFSKKESVFHDFES